MNDKLSQFVLLAVKRGILPVDAGATALESRPWPVILMTAIGAWLAAIPLLLVLFVAFDGILRPGPAAYIVGLIIIATATLMLRATRLPLFAEHLCLPVLLVGGGTLGVGLFRDISHEFAAGALGLVATLCACLVRRDSLRTLLGAAACILAITAVTGTTRLSSYHALLGLELAVLAWLVMQWRVCTMVDMPGGSARARALDSIGLGWVLASLAGLAGWSGMTFLAGGTLGSFSQVNFDDFEEWAFPGPHLASLALAGAAVAWTARCWPSLRKAWSAAVALILMGLAAVMPSLGAVLLLLAVFATAQRWRLTAAAGLAGAWIVGAFYYQLQFALADKAIIMGGAGAVLTACAWFGLTSGGPRVAGSGTHVSPPSARIGIALCGAAVLLVVNIGIWQKQMQIANGKPIFIELAPADPRSLMQGDFMRLNFALLQQMPIEYGGDVNARSRIVVKVDGRGVASFARLGTEAPVRTDEIILQLGQKKGLWTLGTDAWYFKEGEAARWARAQYGEFRVDASGHLSLVGLRGSNLEPL